MCIMPDTYTFIYNVYMHITRQEVSKRVVSEWNCCYYCDLRYILWRICIHMIDHINNMSAHITWRAFSRREASSWIPFIRSPVGVWIMCMCCVRACEYAYVFVNGTYMYYLCVRIRMMHPPESLLIRSPVCISAQVWNNRTLAVHERVDSWFLVLPGSESTITEITEYTYFSPLKPCCAFRYKSG